MISTIFAQSGGPPADALAASAISRKYCPDCGGCNDAQYLQVLRCRCCRTGERRLAEYKCLSWPHWRVLFKVDSV